MVELTRTGETHAAITSTFGGQYMLKVSGTDGTLTATVEFRPGLPPGLSLEGEITATAVDSIAVVSRKEIMEETRLPIADIIDAIRTLLDEVAHTISFYVLTIAAVYSANRMLAAMLAFICGRRERRMPMLGAVCRLLDRVTSG